MRYLGISSLSQDATNNQQQVHKTTQTEAPADRRRFGLQLLSARLGLLVSPGQPQNDSRPKYSRAWLLSSVSVVCDVMLLQFELGASPPPSQVSWLTVP